MRRLLTVLVLLAASRALFAQDDGEPPAPPPKEISPVETVFTVRPVAAELLRVLASGVASPEQIQAAVASMSVADLCQVIVALANTPEQINSLVAAIQSPDLLFRVVVALARSAPSPVVFAKIVTSNPRLEVTVFAFDPARWMAVWELTEKLNTYGGNWLGSAAEHLRKRIATEGYSDGVMAEFQQLKERLVQPVKKNSSGSDSSGYR